MKKLLLLIIFIFGLYIVNAETTDIIAKDYINLLMKGKYELAAEKTDSLMHLYFPTEKAKEIFSQLTTAYGNIDSVGAPEKQKGIETDLYFINLYFPQQTLIAKVPVNPESHLVTGLFFAPGERKGQFMVPQYADTNKFTETTINFGDDNWPLQGTLTLPKEVSNCPLVVLVHGSGPHDRDETVGPNKTFRDLAWGLASKGIAVFRYDKRTYVHGQKIVNEKVDTDIDNEVTDDAVYAVKALAKNTNIDPDRIFVAGHSLGAMMAPRIGSETSKIRGIIMLAAPARPFEDIILEQITYIGGLDGNVSAEEKENLNKLKNQIKYLNSDEFSDNSPADSLPMNMPAVYWESIKDYDQVKTAKKYTNPILILQGERDYQVTMDDLAIWRKELGGKGNVKFITYQDLNHLFMTGKGKATPSEYEKSGNMDYQVIQDIFKWIKAIKD